MGFKNNDVKIPLPICELPKFTRTSSAPLKCSSSDEDYSDVDIDIDADDLPEKRAELLKIKNWRNDLNKIELLKIKQDSSYSDPDFLDMFIVATKEDSPQYSNKNVVIPMNKMIKQISAPTTINQDFLNPSDNFFASRIYFDYYYKQNSQCKKKLPPPIYNYCQKESRSKSLPLPAKIPKKSSSRPTTTRPRFSQKAWIDKFKADNESKSMLEELVNLNTLLPIIRGPEGSCFVRGLLENATVEEKQAVFQVIRPVTKNLCTDRFGYHVIQQLFDKVNQDQRLHLSLQLLGQILHLSLHQYGTHIVQKVIEYASKDTLLIITQELTQRNGVSKCLYNENGNHVIQKCIAKGDPYVIRLIMEGFQLPIVELAKHVYGCRVVQQLLHHCGDEQKIAITNKIIIDTEGLCVHKFGNYVIQDILKKNHISGKKIIEKVRDDILNISKDKFGSNVAEKCLTKGDESDVEEFLKKVLGEQDGDDSNVILKTMMNDKFGNYVIQKMFDVSNSSQKDRIISHMKNLKNDLEMSSFAKYTFSKIEPKAIRKVQVLEIRPN